MIAAGVIRGGCGRLEGDIAPLMSLDLHHAVRLDVDCTDALERVREAAACSTVGMEIAENRTGFEHRACDSNGPDRLRLLWRNLRHSPDAPPLWVEKGHEMRRDEAGRAVIAFRHSRDSERRRANALTSRDRAQGHRVATSMWGGIDPDAGLRRW